MAAPTYSNIGDHTETVQVDFDPDRITYAELLSIFWRSHRPTQRSWSQQYKNAIFYHDDDQKKLAIESKNSLEQKFSRSIATDVAPLRSFTMAEDYHQKYILKSHDELKNEIARIYTRHRDIVDSTAAARLNGYAGHNGSREQLSMEIESLGLSAEGKKALIDLIRK
jgi:peptide methionine sulfoxide reductase MsrA